MTDFTIDGVTFLQRTGSPSSRGNSQENEFVLVKTDSMLRFYEGLRQTLPQNIMEIGMYEGGSLVYFDKLFFPGKSSSAWIFGGHPSRRWNSTGRLILTS